MEVSRTRTINPLGLSLDFMFGRGYLSAARQRLMEWITLEGLRMEIPDLTFPFDARGGLERFRHTRALVRDIEFSISEVGFGDLLRKAAAELEGFEDLQVRFLDGAAHISFKINALGINTYVSFRAALIPPEPAQNDEVHLSLYDYKSFGPLPYPVRLIVHELVTSLLNTELLRAPGRGQAFSVGIAGDILSFHPIKLLLLNVFPRAGWKLPNMAGVVLDSAQIRPGVLSLRAVAQDEHLHRSRVQNTYHIASTPEGARALAAYEAKNLFAHADQALFDGRVREALHLLPNYRAMYGLHPELAARMLDCLLAEPSPANLTEAQILCRELDDDDPQNAISLVARVILALLNGEDEAIREAFDQLSADLLSRSEAADWVLGELAAAQYLEESHPREAAVRLREVLKIAPRSQVALERLSALYDRMGEHGEVESLLKRLAGIYTDRETLKSTYLALARHLIDRSGDLTEARLYLEKALRLDPTELQALFTLGECYILGGEPLRALKAFGAAARAAEAENDAYKASYFHYRVAQIWSTEVDNSEQALLSCRRALALLPVSHHDLQYMSARIEYLQLAAHLCMVPSRQEEAIAFWVELIPLLEKRQEGATPTLGQLQPFTTPGEALLRVAGMQQVESDSDDPEVLRSVDQRLIDAHQHLASIYESRDRRHVAATHWRRILEVEPGHNVALEHLENHLLQSGRPEELIELYKELLLSLSANSRIVQVHQKLADVYEGMGLFDDSLEQLRAALIRNPTDAKLRQQVAEKLIDSQQYEALQELFSQILSVLHEPEERFDALLVLAENWQRLGENYFHAARTYLEALQLYPANVSALLGACTTLDKYVASEGPDAKAPAGSQSAGQLLERLWIRLAELSTESDVQYRAFTRYAELAEERGDAAAAAQALQRAREIHELFFSTDNQIVEEVDDRLDSLLDELGVFEEEDAPEGSEPQASPLQSAPNALEVETETRIVGNQASEAEPAHFEQSGDAASEGAVSEGSENEAQVQVDEHVPALEGFLVADPAGEFEEYIAQSADAADFNLVEETDTSQGEEAQLVEFREKFQDVFKRSGKLPELDNMDAGSPFGQLIEESQGVDENSNDTWQRDVKTVSSGLEPLESNDEQPEEHAHTHEEQNTLDDLRHALDELAQKRAEDNPESICRAIEQVLEIAQNTGDSGTILSSAQRFGLLRELGEILYYDLEDSRLALKYLEAVRRDDPEGVGKAPSVLNALEAIYEEEGRIDARLVLLESRLSGAETQEMANTYRLLLAQLVWDETQDSERAKHWLDGVLEDDPEHEAAHRLLAEIAIEEQKFHQAAAHLQIVLKVASGGLDTVEIERELADLCLHQLSDPERALRHYQRVLEAAPADAGALEGIKKCQVALEDWHGYLASLGKELGLLIGRFEGLSLDELCALRPKDVPEALHVTTSQILSDIADIVECELSDFPVAQKLWGVAFNMWPEQVEALERRIELDHQLSAHEDLALDLEMYSQLLLDPTEQFAALVECARIYERFLEQPEEARRLYQKAVSTADEAGIVPRGLDDARKALEMLHSMDVEN